MNFCKDCKHHKRKSIEDVCHRQVIQKIDMVRGKEYYINTLSCSEERNSVGEEYCGEMAIYFERKK